MHSIGVAHIVSSPRGVQFVSSFQLLGLIAILDRLLSEWLELFDEVGVGRAGQAGNRKILRERVAGEELVTQNLLYRQPLGRLQLKHFRNEVFGAPAQLNAVGEGIVAHPNLVVGGLDVISLKGWSTNQQSVRNDSEAPDIDFIRMAAFV